MVDHSRQQRDRRQHDQLGRRPGAVLGEQLARAEMAAVAKFRDDIAGAITTGGSSTAYTAMSSQGFNSLANMSGKMIAFVPHTTNGTTVTLNVDGLGAKPLRSAPSAELLAGVLVQGTPYVATYYNATQEWILHGFYGNPYNVPLGGMLEFTGTTAPNSSFVLPFGQAISRTTYAAYFSMVGTTYGAGDGSTTFNVIDKRGRVSAGKDDMGAAQRPGSPRRARAWMGRRWEHRRPQNVTVLQANLPAVTLTTTIAAGQGDHPHSWTSPVNRNGGAPRRRQWDGDDLRKHGERDAAGNVRHYTARRLRHDAQQDATHGDRELHSADTLNTARFRCPAIGRGWRNADSPLVSRSNVPSGRSASSWFGTKNAVQVFTRTAPPAARTATCSGMNHRPDGR